jgi:hypothetical protein
LRDVGEDPRSAVKECKAPEIFMNYMMLMNNIIDVKTFSFEEETE